MNENLERLHGNVLPYGNCRRQRRGRICSFYPDLPGCITCGETIDSAVENAQDAKKAWLEAALEEGIEIHEPNSLEDDSGLFKLRISRSLHRSLAEHL